MLKGFLVGDGDMGVYVGGGTGTLSRLGFGLLGSNGSCFITGI